MKYKNINGTNLEVSGICLGTANFGTEIDEKQSYELMDMFVDQGGNFIDTAHIYSDWIPGEKSRSEKIIGKWMKQRENRNKIFIATKGGSKLTGSKARLSYKEITKDLHESLSYLHTDHIDIYWLHRDQPERNVEEILDTLISHQKEGLIKYYACSNWSPNRIIEANKYAEKVKSEGFIANQMQWSLAKMNKENLEDKTMLTMDEECMKFHLSSKMCVISYSSQASGYFSKLEHDDSKKLDRLYGNEYNKKVFEKVKELSKVKKISINAISLAYIISQKSFTAIPIIGCKNRIQLEDSLSALTVDLDERKIKWLEEDRW